MCPVFPPLLFWKLQPIRNPHHPRILWVRELRKVIYSFTNITRSINKEGLIHLISKGASGNTLQIGVKVKSNRLGKSK